MTGRGWIVLVAFGAVLPASAQWQLIDDFQQWEADQEYHEASDIGWHAAYWGESDEYWMQADWYDPDNIAMFFEDPWAGQVYGALFIQKELPDGGIFPGNTGTLFCRSYWAGFYPIWHFGTADKELAYDEVTGLQIAPGAWSDFNAVIRRGDERNIEHRDGDEYVSTDPPQIVDAFQWYSFWLIVENSWDRSTNPPTSTGVYTLYMQGPGIGDGVNPTLIPVGTDPPKDKASFRRAPVDNDGNPRPIIWVQFASSIPVPMMNWSNFLIDDIYFSAGINLTDPTDSSNGSCWGYCADEDGDVDTGDFLGWLNVTQAPYIWSYSLNGWLYMEEPAAAAPGAWGYFFK